MSDELENCSLLLSTQLFAAKENLDKLILAQTAHTKQIQDQQKALSKIPGQIIAEQKTLFDFQQETNQVKSRIGGLSAEKAQLEKDVSYLQIKIDSKNTELEAVKFQLNEVKQATKDAKIVAGEVDLILKKMTKDITAAKRREKPVVSLLDFEISGEGEAKMMENTALVYLAEMKIHTTELTHNHVRKSLLQDGKITEETEKIWKPFVRILCETFYLSKATNSKRLVNYVINQRLQLQRTPYKTLASEVKKMVGKMDPEDCKSLENDEQKHASGNFLDLIKKADKKNILKEDLEEDILSWMFENSFIVPKSRKAVQKRKVDSGEDSFSTTPSALPAESLTKRANSHTLSETESD